VLRSSRPAYLAVEQPPIVVWELGQQFAEFDFDLLRTKRLDKQFADPRSLARSDCVTRCENYLEMRPKTPCLFGKLDAAQPWPMPENPPAPPGQV
jgi:hypothetical protein